MATRIGTGYVTVEPDFSGFQEKVGAKLNSILGPAMDKAGKNANKRLSKSLGDNASVRNSFAPLLKRFEKFGDDAGEQIAAKVGKGAKRAEGDLFGLSGAIKEMEKHTSSASSKAKIFANDTFGIAHAARDAGQGYKLLRNSTSNWTKDAKAADRVGERLSKGVASLARDALQVGRNLKASAGGFGNFEGIMARANRGLQFSRNILGSLKLPTAAAGLALLAQSLSALAAGAVGTVSALAPLSGALIALPALALAGASAVGTLKLALSGIGDAVKAATAVQVQGGEQATQVLRQQESAAEAVADANRTLKAAERDAGYATEDLTKARKDATAQLHELERASRESRLTEQEGTLALREARKELNKTLREPGSTGFDIRAAEQAVERAEFGLDATREEAKKARKDYADANKKGVEGMPEIVSAKRAAADADRSLKDAERGVEKAVRENTDALKQQGSAATALQQKMAELTPSGRKFAKFLISLKPRYDELRETASKGLFPGAESGIKDALKNAGVIKKIVGETSGALGGLAAKAGAKLGSDAWGRDLAKIGESDTRIIERLGQAGLNLGDAFRNAMVSAEPLLDWMSEGTVKFSEWLKTASQTGRETGSLSHFFDETRGAMERVWRILKPLGEGFLNVGHYAKGLGNEILDSLGDSAEGWAKWTKSTSGQNTLKNYFKEVKPTIYAIGRLVRDATDDFAEMGATKGPAKLIETIRTKLLPLLSGGANGITGLLGGFLEKWDDLRKEGVPAFDAFIQVLAEHAAEGAKAIAKALVNSFINSSVWGKLAIGGWLLSKFGGGAAFLKLGGTLGRFLGIGIGTGAGEAISGKSAAGGIAGGLLGTLKNIKWGRVAGLGLGVALADTVMNEFSRRSQEHSGDLFAALKAGAEHTKILGVSIPGDFGDILQAGLHETADDLRNRKDAFANLKAEYEEMAAKRVKLSQATIEGLRAQAQEVDLSKEARAQLEKMLNLAEAGRKLGLKVGLNSEGQVREIHAYLKGFDLLKSGTVTRLGDVSKVAQENLEHITASFKQGTPKWRSAVVENMKASVAAIRTGMKEGVIEQEKGQKRIQELARGIRLFEGRDPLGLAKAFSESWGKAGKVTQAQIESQIGELRKLPKGAQEQARNAMVRMARALESEGKLVKGSASKLTSALTTTFGRTNNQLADSTAKTMAHITEAIESGARAVGKGIQNVFENMSGALEAMGAKNVRKFDIKVLSAASQYHHAREEMPGFQGGGLASVVPGSSTGDRHILALNGRPIAKVESKEGIFVGNRNLMAAAKEANDRHPRFPGRQTGGLVRGALQHLATGGLVEPKLEGNAGPLKQLGQAAIGKVVEGAKAALAKQQSVGGGGEGGSIANAGPLQQFNRIFPSHTLSEVSGKARFSEALAARIARWAGLPGRLFGQIAHGESDFYPGVYGIDPGGTIGRGLWQITSGVGNDEMIAKYGGPQAMFNPLINAEVAKQIYDSAGIGAWYGTKFVTGMADGGLLRAAAGGALSAPHRHRGFDPAGRNSKFAPLLRSTTSGALGGTAARAVAWARNNLGTQQGSAKQERWGPDPWCGYFFGADMSAQGVPLPPNPGGTSSYENEWDSGSDPVSGLGSADPGDFLGFNGKHTAMYVGGGQMISGNWGDEVAQDSVSAEGEPLTSVRRPKYPGGSGASGAAGTHGAGTTKLPPKEKALPSYGGVSTGQITFGHPKTLKATEAELDRLTGKDGKSGLLKRYRSAANKADKDGKKATADLLTKRVSEIEQRVAGLQKQRRQLRLSEAVKNLKKRITGKLTKIGGYDIRVQGAQRLYEQASEYAGNVVALEPEAPEIAPEPELPESATDKQRRDAHNAYEQQREGIEKDYANRYSAYVEGQERPAYQTVLERVADWRNIILRSERFGFGDEKHPSIDGIGRGWEKGAQQKINKIGAINDFTKVVGERIQDYWAKVKKDVSDWRGDHPNAKDLPGWLKKEQDGVPDWLKKQEETRDHLREQLPFLRDQKGQLETAVGEAREAFFSGGDNRLVDPPTLTNLPLPGSGTFEGYLEEVQGIHLYPAMHELLGAGALAPPRDPSKFGGVIWSVQEAIEGLGLKVRQAGNSVQKASLEGAGSGAGDQGNSEREQLLEELLGFKNQRAAITAALEPVLSQFEASYPLPFAGTFHSGGTIAGPSSQEYMAKVRGTEHVLTSEQMAALTPAGEATAGGAPVIERLVIHPDGSATMRYEGREFETAVREVVRSTPPAPGRGNGFGRTLRP